ncbi:MAG: hypothetical protein J7K63_06330 [Candidatus Marinimicrobia bacterium]|nr:hypothetical protein [Candidatus Neomarinimicrobiota bacterium]
MIHWLKVFFSKSLNTAYDCVDAIGRGETGVHLTETLTESIRRSMVSAHLLGVATGHENFFREIGILQRILNICQVYILHQGRILYFEASAYQNRKGALRGALYVETLQRKDFESRRKKLPFQLEKSFHPERKAEFLHKIERLPESITNPDKLHKVTLDYLIPLVLIKTVDFGKLTMKLPGELLPDFEGLHAFLLAMGQGDVFWKKDVEIIHKIIKGIRTVLYLDENFSTVKKVLLEEREKTIQLLKGNIFDQYKMLNKWDEVLRMLATRNDKGLIKFLTQLVRDRKEAVDELRSLQKTCEEKELWKNYYKKIENLFVTSDAV